jgi:hypothetical protein
MLNLPRIGKGDPITARWLNRVVDYVRSLRIVTDGSILVDHTPGGQVLRVDLGGGLGSTSIPIYVGTGGIPGRDGITPGKSTTVLVLDWVGETLPTSGVTATTTVYNVSSTAVKANRYGKADWTKGKWVVDVESCS